MMPGTEEFHVVGGGGDPTMVLLPGWATDGRIFEGALPGVTAVTTGPLRPEGFPRRLAAYLDRTVRGAVTVVGWSLGGFLAAEFAREYPDRVRRAVLVGIRREYPEEDVKAVLGSLLADPGGCLSGFYAQCFYPSQIPAYRRFRSGLQAAYLREMDGGALREGLSYLAKARLSGETLPACPVAIVHGEKDVVAPFAEAERLARECGNASFHPLPGAAHAAFLADGFRALIADGQGWPSAATGREASGSNGAADG
jgi:pimeloyl-ACP methyl ester carboxylesterase